MAAAKATMNWFAFWVTTTVLALLVMLGIIVGLLNSRSIELRAIPEGSLVNAQTGAIRFGSGEIEVDTYVDFMCPTCKSFEAKTGTQLWSAALSEKITLNVHPVAILDRFSGDTKYSSRAASAAYCVAEQAPSSFKEFFELLFQHQPAENSAGLTNAALADLAEHAGAGTAESCIKKETFVDYVARQVKKDEITKTPTIRINGEFVEPKEIATKLAGALNK